MTDAILSSDVAILDLLRSQDEMTIRQLTTVLEVTDTAVRHRLKRLLQQQLVERNKLAPSRGRPQHIYRLTSKGRRRSGENFADLAIALWQEIRSIQDPEVRNSLMARISSRMAAMYESQIPEGTLRQRIQSVVELFEQRQLPIVVDESGKLPILSVEACPYPELAEDDRGVCSMEQMLFSEVLGEKVELTSCRLDGDCGCTFEFQSEEVLVD